MQFLTHGLSFSKDGHLKIGECDTLALAKKFGTPVYVVNEEVVRARCKEYKQAIKKYYGGRGQILFASKAFNCLEICRIVQDEGLGLDVVSEGELYTALKAGFSAKEIHFHGNNKTKDELYFALKSGVGRVVVDNFYELEILEKICCELKTEIKIAIRVKPGIEAHTHEFIKTGQIDSKFGFALETGEAMQAVKCINKIQNIKLKELHCHIGSQIFSVDPFIFAARVMITFMADIFKETGLRVEELNLGGGFGINYTERDKALPFEKYISAVAEVLQQKAHDLKLPIPFIYLEPGRSIVGEAGLTLYTVGAVKDIPNVRTYVMVDGGICDNPRYALYHSEYTAVVANKADKAKDIKGTIAGKCCESGDLIQENIYLQKPEPGDVLAVLATGAYNYSMASNYNRIPKPAVVMVNDGEARIIVRRESLDDLLANDV